MKRYAFLLIIMWLSQWAQAQDIIVTVENDTIACKITRISEEFIHFSVFDRSGILLMQSRLPVTKIKYYNQDTTVSDDNAGKVPELKEEDKFILDYFDPATFRLAINTGFTYQLGGYSGLPESYKKQVQSLWNFGGEFHYFASENIGVGAKYSHIRTTANGDFEPPVSTAFGFSSLRDERIRFNYIGLSILYRNFLYDDQSVNYFISGGIVKYRTDGLGDGVPFYQEGDTYSLILGVSYDFILSEYFGLGFGAEINLARLAEFDNNGTVSFADFNLTRLDFTIGVRLFK